MKKHGKAILIIGCFAILIGAYIVLFVDRERLSRAGADADETVAAIQAENQSLTNELAESTEILGGIRDTVYSASERISIIANSNSGARYAIGASLRITGELITLIDDLERQFAGDRKTVPD